MSYQNLLVDDLDAVRRITLNRPDKLNALDRLTLDELHAAFADTAASGAIRAVVLTGAGRRRSSPGPTSPR